MKEIKNNIKKRRMEGTYKNLFILKTFLCIIFLASLIILSY